MKKYEKYQREDEILTETICDLCGRTAHHKHGNWASGAYATEETTLRFRWGSNYPEGGSGFEYEVDICPDCFRNKLMPWLDAQGCKAKATEWDW